MKHTATLPLWRNWLIKLLWHPKNLLCWNCSFPWLPEHRPFWRIKALVQVLAVIFLPPLITCAHTYAHAAIPTGNVWWSQRADYWLRARIQQVMQPRGLTSLYSALVKLVWRGKNEQLRGRTPKSDTNPRKQRGRKKTSCRIMLWFSIPRVRQESQGAVDSPICSDAPRSAVKQELVLYFLPQYPFLH